MAYPLDVGDRRSKRQWQNQSQSYSVCRQRPGYYHFLCVFLVNNVCDPF
ncbi:hypothetical protein WKK05_04090 [Nostoc sp. UHCC 0302]